jgi:hypothetical protein
VFCLWMNLWLKTKLLAAYCHCCPHLVPRDLLLFPKRKMLLKWGYFNVTATIVAKSRYALYWVSNIALHKVTWSLGSLCTVPERPVWKGWHWAEGRYCRGEANLVQKPFCLYRQFYCLKLQWYVWHWFRVWVCQRILKQGCRSHGWPNFILWVPNICGPSVWMLLYITLLVPRILRWLLDFRKFCVPGSWRCNVLCYALWFWFGFSGSSVDITLLQM